MYPSERRGNGQFGSAGNRARIVGPRRPQAAGYLGRNVTYCDYNMVMKTVRIAELKARLSEHLRAVRKGHTLTVLDRDTPVARIVPYAAEPLEMRRSTRRLRELKLPPSPSTATDSLAILLDDRRRR
jgi:prevent-host-death family protein